MTPIARAALAQRERAERERASRATNRRAQIARTRADLDRAARTRRASTRPIWAEQRVWSWPPAYQAWRIAPPDPRPPHHPDPARIARALYDRMLDGEHLDPSRRLY